MIVVTDERCTEYRSPGHPERPERILRTVEHLRSLKDKGLHWESPDPVSVETLLRGHTAEHLQHLGKPKGDFDGDTPAYPGILDHALRGVGGALRALKRAREGQTVLSLLRPPGHHATRSQAMGFCYLSTVGLTALEARATGSSRVAILDFDVHHGNGTEALVAGHPGIFFASVHQHPCYPGTGTQDVGANVFNYPIPPEYPRTEYRRTLRQALDRLLGTRPELLMVSAGFDAYARDPIAHETLELEDFTWLGTQIRGADLPTLSVLEGGYSDDLPQLVEAYLQGVRRRT